MNDGAGVFPVREHGGAHLDRRSFQKLPVIAGVLSPDRARLGRAERRRDEARLLEAAHVLADVPVLVVVTLPRFDARVIGRHPDGADVHPA